jgi:hypothetical protein
MGTDYPRELPLFDPGREPGTWNERMGPGEFAVHYSSFEGEGRRAPYCTVFGAMEDAVAYAQRKVAERPALRCRIYDNQGLIGPELRDIRGVDYRENGQVSVRFRRSIGAICLFGGLILLAIDWNANFRYSWPALIGVRLLIPGVLLAVFEMVIVVRNRRVRLDKEAQIS